jgi:transposase
MEVVVMARVKLLTDAQWEKLEPLVPRTRRSLKGGRPRASDRDAFEGILWILWTGAPWRALPEKYPSPSTCWRRLRDWEEDGTWERIWIAFVQELDEAEQLEWSESFTDASFIPAKKGAQRSAPQSGARAQSYWYWRTARVFLSVATFRRLPRPKSRSSSRRSKKRAK